MASKPFYGISVNTSTNQTAQESTHLTSHQAHKRSLGILTIWPALNFLGPAPNLLRLSGGGIRESSFQKGRKRSCFLLKIHCTELTGVPLSPRAHLNSHGPQTFKLDTSTFGPTFLSFLQNEHVDLLFIRRKMHWA